MQQRVEILKVLMTGARIVILDEPTSVLAPQEVASLFAMVRHLRDLGFRFVTLDLEGFRSGSLNTLVPLESKLRFQPPPGAPTP